ncbi:MAG: hypothetical protein LBU40_04180, partial [Methanobrevibacter sp.]|nr:hypothetical protein [Methanobrevibacter sp.]
KTDNYIKKLISEIYVKIASLEMKESFQEEDKLLIQSINSLDEIDESVSKLVERIREWYSIYFPEVEIIQNNNSYIKIIADYGDREEIIKNNLKEFNLDVHISNGADLEKEDIEIVKRFANSIKSLQKSRKDIDDYIDVKMDKIAPNLKDLVGSTLGAKLIAHVGSVKRLALFPSGTIQILGAEKALFRHLKTGEDPPKHGLIYQHPEIRGAKWWLRGKISRTLALKISLAVRKDVFSGVFDPTNRENFLKKVEDIANKNPFPPTKRQLEKRKLKSKSGNRKNKSDKSNKDSNNYKYIKTKSFDSPTINFKKKKRNKVKGKKLLKDLDY